MIMEWYNVSEVSDHIHKKVNMHIMTRKGMLITTLATSCMGDVDVVVVEVELWNGSSSGYKELEFVSEES